MEHNNDFYQDFDRFSRALMGSKDADPVYPFIKDTLTFFPEFEPEWFCIAYTTFYSLESAMKFCLEFPTMDDYKTGRFYDMRDAKIISKMGHERRGSQRNPINQDKIFTGYIEARTNWSLDFSTNLTFRRTLSENVPFHGAWASFKVAEVFEKALDMKQLSIPDLGLEGKDVNSNDGPISGLRWLYGRDNVYDKKIVKSWNKFGELMAEGWGCDMGEVETCLCKWHKLVTGNYYVGHDVDELNELTEAWGEIAFDEIMFNNFDKRFLQGVNGIRKQFKKTYYDTNVILNDDLIGNYKPVDILETILKTI